MMTEVATRDGCADECQRFFLAHRREDSLASALIGGGILSDHVQVEAAITDHQCRRTRPPAQMRLNRRASASDTDELSAGTETAKQCFGSSQKTDHVAKAPTGSRAATGATNSRATGANRRNRINPSIGCHIPARNLNLA